MDMKLPWAYGTSQWMSLSDNRGVVGIFDSRKLQALTIEHGDRVDHFVRAEAEFFSGMALLPSGSRSMEDVDGRPLIALYFIQKEMPEVPESLAAYRGVQPLNVGFAKRVNSIFLDLHRSLYTNLESMDDIYALHYAAMVLAIEEIPQTELYRQVMRQVRDVALTTKG